MRRQSIYPTRNIIYEAVKNCHSTLYARCGCHYQGHHAYMSVVCSWQLVPKKPLKHEQVPEL